MSEKVILGENTDCIIVQVSSVWHTLNGDERRDQSVAAITIVDTVSGTHMANDGHLFLLLLFLPAL